MEEFKKNAIVTVVAAVLAFGFAFALELIKRYFDNKKLRSKSRSLALLSLKATQKILESIKTRYQDINYFDFIYLDQLTEIARQQDALRFGEGFFDRKADQSTYFNLISRLYLLAANMRTIQQFTYNADPSEQTTKEFITKKQTEFIAEAGQISQKIDDMINILDK